MKNGRAGSEMKNLIILTDYFSISIDYFMARTDRKEIHR